MKSSSPPHHGLVESGDLRDSTAGLQSVDNAVKVPECLLARLNLGVAWECWGQETLVHKWLKPNDAWVV